MRPQTNDKPRFAAFAPPSARFQENSPGGKAQSPLSYGGSKSRLFAEYGGCRQKPTASKNLRQCLRLFFQ